jgi:hypothetical protein
LENFVELIPPWVFIDFICLDQLQSSKFGELALHITKIQCITLVDGGIANTFGAKFWF